MVNGMILLLAVVTSGMETLGIAAFFPVFNSLLTDGAEVPGGILGITTDIANLLPIDDHIIAASVFLIAVFVAKVAFSIARDIMIARASAQVQYDVKQEIMERYSGAHYQFYLDNKQGALIYVAQVAPNAVRGLILKGAQGIGFALKISFFAILLGLIFPVALAAFAGLGILYYGVFHYLAQKVSLHIGIGRARAGSQQTVIHNEFLGGIHQIITLRAGRRWLEQFKEENLIHSNLYKKELIWLSIPRQFIEFSAVAMMVGLILVFRALNPESFGAFLPKLGVLGIGLFQLLPAVASIGRLRMELMSGLPDMELVHRALTDPIPRREAGDIELTEFQDSVDFKQASFAHKDRNMLLENVDLSFRKGQVTAIVGPSGSGKTTMVNLILGLFDPCSGYITVDGTPIKNLTEESWLGKIGYVSQEPFIYHASIADNIIFGRIGYDLDDAIAAARIANAHDFITNLPTGYDTVVGERGMKISGGQQQRIAIARAILTSPEILIFDEATSSLDSISERIVQEAIDTVSKNRTAIIIAHRLSTIRKADKIVVLDRGRVVEQGNHDELLARNGDYYRLVQSTS